MLIPAFAVDRTELVLLELARLARAGEIRECQCFSTARWRWRPSTSTERRSTRAGSRSRRSQIRSTPATCGSPAPRRSPRCSTTRACPASSCRPRGMATGGRVVHHSRSQLPDPRNTVILVGYQAVGTRGRDLRDGARHLKMHGRYVPVRCDVVELSDYSVHADADEVVAWLASAPRAPDTCFVVTASPRRPPCWPNASPTTSAGVRWCLGSERRCDWTDRRGRFANEAGRSTLADEPAVEPNREVQPF